ncbi:recombinase family protein [Microbacterium sp. RURRCA19A]|uniref:recombinase family protein n=1 Tax=Microbacterium sp. RURRCA19A TaxID=1907391 RepID=UPI000953EA2A|nr:recombinase family protein [Microbacterium sp. RURRCA19A]SIS19769.1 Recombinase [Microbacterium sp. RURRCA19A]
MRSRAFRNAGDAAITKRILAGMGVKLISAKEDFGDGYMAEAMEAVTDIMNEVQVRQSGEDIKQKLLNKAKNGGTVGRAKLGYINDRKDFDGRLVNTIGIDEARAPLIRWAFEQYASGDYSTTKLSALLAEQGLTTRKSSKWPERPLSRSQLGQILRDPYYIGMVTFKGHVYPGRHEPLITPELFDRVQQVIDARVKRGQRDRVHNHFARGLLHCGRCHAAGREHRLIFAEAKNHAGEIYEYFLCRGRQDGLCDLPYLPVAELERALQREFRTVILSPDGIATAKKEVGAALERVLADQAQQRGRLQKELKRLDVQEERLVDLAAEGALATDKLRARLRDLQIKKHEVRASLETTNESLEQRTQMVLSYLDLMARPDALFTSVPGSVKRKLIAAFFQRIWVDDDGHLVTAAHELQPLPAAVHHAALSVTTNEKSAGEISDASSAERANLYLKVICSSKTTLVAGAGLEPATSRLGLPHDRGFVRDISGCRIPGRERERPRIGYRGVSSIPRGR